MSSTWRVVKDILCKQGKSEAPGKIIHEEKEITSAGDHLPMHLTSILPMLAQIKQRK